MSHLAMKSRLLLTGSFAQLAPNQTQHYSDPRPEQRGGHRPRNRARHLLEHSHLLRFLARARCPEVGNSRPVASALPIARAAARGGIEPSAAFAARDLSLLSDAIVLTPSSFAPNSLGSTVSVTPCGGYCLVRPLNHSPTMPVPDDLAEFVVIAWRQADFRGDVIGAEVMSI